MDHKPAAEQPDDLGKQLAEATSGSDLDYTDDNAGPFGRAINRVAEVVGVAILIVTSALVFLNAVMRYTVDMTFIWADELVILLFPWLGMIGVFLAIRRRQVILIDFFVNFIPARVWQRLTIFASLFAAAAFVYLAIISLDYVQLFGGDRSIYLKLKKGWFTSAFVIGSAMAAAAYAVVAIKDLRAGKRN